MVIPLLAYQDLAVLATPTFAFMAVAFVRRSVYFLSPLLANT